MPSQLFQISKKYTALKPSRRQRYFLKAEKYERNGQFDKSMVYYRKCLINLEEDPSFPNIAKCLRTLSKYYWDNGEKEKSLKFIEAEQLYYQNMLEESQGIQQKITTQDSSLTEKRMNSSYISGPGYHESSNRNKGYHIEQKHDQVYRSNNGDNVFFAPEYDSQPSNSENNITVQFLPSSGKFENSIPQQPVSHTVTLHASDLKQTLPPDLAFPANMSNSQIAPRASSFRQMTNSTFLKVFGLIVAVLLSIFFVFFFASIARTKSLSTNPSRSFYQCTQARPISSPGFHHYFTNPLLLFRSRLSSSKPIFNLINSKLLTRLK